MTNYTLHQVTTSYDAKQFIKVAVKLYKNDPNWIRPLDNDINNIFNPEKNLLFKEGEAIRWILKDQNGDSVGRIAAFYNTRVANESEQPTGGCGFFECINSQEAANILFDASREWLLTKGMEAMDGSINFGDRDTFWGVLVDNFKEPVYGMNYNFPYYKDLFESYGFQNYFNQFCYSRTIDKPISEIVRVKYERIMASNEYTFRPIKIKDLKQVGRDFVKIYNKAWAGFGGVTEMTEKQGQELVKTLKPIVDPELIYFGFYKGEAIGFFIQIPDLNQVTKHLNGKFSLWHKLKLLYLLKVKKVCNNIVGLIFAVTPEHQGKGIESGMMNSFAKGIKSKKTHYKTLEFTWVGDFNPLMNRMMQTYVEGEKSTTHTTFRYLFDREKPFTRAPKVSRSRQIEKKES